MKIVNISWLVLLGLGTSEGVFHLKHDVDSEFANAFKQLNLLEDKAKSIEADRQGLAETTRTSMHKLDSIEQADQADMMATVKKGEESLDLLNSGLMQKLSKLRH